MLKHPIFDRFLMCVCGGYGGEGRGAGGGGVRGQLFFSSDYEVGLEVSFTLLAYWLFSLSTKGNKATSN